MSIKDEYILSVINRTIYCRHGYECTECCFLFIGGRNSSGKGYTRSGYQKVEGVHRLMWMWFTGQDKLAKGVTINHLCNRGNCWQPYHLYEGTQEENMADKALSARGVDLIVLKMDQFTGSHTRTKAKKLLIMLMDVLGLNPDEAMHIVVSAAKEKGIHMDISDDDIEAMRMYQELTEE